MRTSLIAFCTAAGVVALAAVLVRTPDPLPPPLEERVELPEPPKLIEVARETGSTAAREFGAIPSQPYGSLRIGLWSRPTVAEYGRRGAETGQQLIDDLVDEGLTQWDPRTLRVIAGVAERWESDESARTWRFHIDTSRRWSNGDPVTAREFVQAWLLRLRRRTHVPALWKIVGALGARPSGDWPNLHAEDVKLRSINNGQTLEVELKRPCPEWPMLVATSGMGPLHPDSKAEKPFPPLPAPRPVTGWFQPIHDDPPDRGAPDSLGELVLVRNPHHPFARAPGPERVIVRGFKKSAERVSAFERGELDWVPSVAAVDVERSPLASRVRSLRCWGITALQMGYRGDNNPLANPLLREAVTRAIDRTRLTVIYPKSAAVPCDTLLPPSQESQRAKPSSAVRRTESPPDGRAAPDQPAAQELTLTLPSVSGRPGKYGRALADELARQLREQLGINVRLVLRDWKQFQHTVQASEFHLAITGWHPNTPLPSAMLPDPETHAWQSMTYQTGYRDAQQRAGSPAGRDAAEQAARELARGNVFVPLLRFRRLDLVARRFSGPPENGFGEWLTIRGGAGLFEPLHPLPANTGD